MLPATTKNTCTRYTVQDLVTAELRNVLVARIRFYADGKLEITGDLLKVFFQQLENQGKYHIRSISAIRRGTSADEFVVKVDWEGREEAERTWASVSCVFHHAPAALMKELKVLRLKEEQTRALVQRYGDCVCD